MPASILQAVCTINGVLPPPPPITGPTATFGIGRWDGNTDDELVAPVAVAFRPTNITGFVGVDGEPISEPAGDTNVYDPTALEIFWSWSFGDPGYEPLVPVNLPAAMRDLNRAYAKRPWHVMHAPGPKTVTLFGYDTRGNWGTATFTFGPGGDAPAIADPATHFEGRRVYFSAEGDFSEVPAGVPPADRVTTVSAANSRLTALWGTGVTFARLDLRRGEVYTFGGGQQLGGFRNLYVSCYGDPSASPPKHFLAVPPPDFDSVIAISNGTTGFPRIVDIDFEGPYDAATETGRRTSAVLANSGRNGRRHLYHRVRVSGFNAWDIAKSDDVVRIFSDCEVTNWQDYGIFGSDGRRMTLAILGGDFHQKANALSGNDHGTGQSNFANLTNRHGPIRINTVRDLYVACASFFSRNGWSSRFGPGQGNTAPPTTVQPCFRITQEASGTPINYRNYSAFDRCGFEAGSLAINMTDFTNSNTAGVTQANVVIESCLMVASRDYQEWIGGKARGFSMRNGYFYAPSVDYLYDGGASVTFRFQNLVTWNFAGAADPAGPSKAFVFNNTGYILATNAQAGSPISRVVANIAADHNPVIEGNVLYGPNFSPALGSGTFSTPTLAGFTSRFLGTRFNFPPIGHPSMGALITAQSVRELSPGGSTGVADGEWISLPYPDFTGKCNGALGQVTRTMVESALPSGGVRYHQVSLYDLNVKAAASASAGGDGRVAFAFTDTAIRVQNLSGITWTGNLWVLLDLRDRLMGFIPGTETPSAIPLLIAASTPTPPIPAARLDLLGAERNLDGPFYPGALVPA